MSPKSSDRVEESVVLRVPRARVWQALTDAEEFGEWFGVKLAGEFVPGVSVKGSITSEGYEGMPFEMAVERVEPPSLFSWRWHPYAIDPEIDYSGEEPTLVECTLKDEPGGTRLTVVETGFDAIPASRRDEAYAMHEQGWDEQMKSIARHLAKAA